MNIRILVVDDEEEIRNIFKELLNAKGYKVEIAKDGNEAIEWLKKIKFNLLISDTVGMKLGYGGPFFIEELGKLQKKRKIYQDIFVIVYTANIRPDVLIRLIKARVVDDIVEKPDRDDKFYKTIKSDLWQLISNVES